MKLKEPFARFKMITFHGGVFPNFSSSNYGFINKLEHSAISDDWSHFEGLLYTYYYSFYMPDQINEST